MRARKTSAIPPVASFLTRVYLPRVCVTVVRTKPHEGAAPKNKGPVPRPSLPVPLHGLTPDFTRSTASENQAVRSRIERVGLHTVSTASTPANQRGAPVVRVGDVLTVADVAALLNLSKPKVYAMVSSGELASFRIGAAVRVHRSAVDRLVHRLRGAGASGGANE
ncbi:MAG: helix-turn-helix domain-containing protein [Archangium sp.]